MLRLIKVFVEAEIFPRHQLRGENDLPCMIREVLHDMIDGFAHGTFVALTAEGIRQLFLSLAIYDLYCFRNSLVQSKLELGNRGSFARRELEVALALVGSPANS